MAGKINGDLIINDNGTDLRKLKELNAEVNNLIPKVNSNTIKSQFIKQVAYENSNTYNFVFNGYSGTMLMVVQTNYCSKERTIVLIITCLANSYFVMNLESGVYTPNITHSFNSNTNQHTFSVEGYAWGVGFLIGSGTFA